MFARFGCHPLNEAPDDHSARNPPYASRRMGHPWGGTANEMQVLRFAQDDTAVSSILQIGSATLHERIERESPVAGDALRIFARAKRVQHGLVYEEAIDLVELVVVGVELPERGCDLETK